MKMNAGLVPDVEHFTSLGSEVPELTGIPTLEDVPVVLLLSDAHRQVPERVPAQIQSVELPQGLLGPVHRRIVGRGAVPMAIPRMEIKVRQIGIGSQRVGQRVGREKVEQGGKIDFTSPSRRAANPCLNA